MFYRTSSIPFYRTLLITASPYTVLHRKIPSISLFPTQFFLIFLNFFRGCDKEIDNLRKRLSRRRLVFEKTERSGVGASDVKKVKDDLAEFNS